MGGCAPTALTLPSMQLSVTAAVAPPLSVHTGLAVHETCFPGSPCTNCWCWQANLSELKMSVETFGTKFDVVLVDPPWEEYARRAPGAGPDTAWNWQAIKALEIENITATPSFVFLWHVMPAPPPCLGLAAPLHAGASQHASAVH